MSLKPADPADHAALPAVVAALPRALRASLLAGGDLRRDGSLWVVEVADPAWAEAWRVAVPADPALRIVVSGAAAAGTPAAVPAWEPLDGVLADPGNQLAIAACRRVAAAPGAEHNPLYLHGPAGCGKTRLLHGVCAAIAEACDDPAAVVWMTGEDFVAAHAGELASGRSDGLRERLRRAVAIVVDGMDVVSGRALAQEQLFAVVNAARDEGRQLLFAGRQPPLRLGLEERLATRLAWGLVEGIEPPHAETRLALLRRISRRAAAGDIARLAALVDRYAADGHGVHALATRLERGDNLDGEAEGIPFERILQAVAERTRVRPADIAGQGRAQAVSRARQTVALLARRLTPLRLADLGGMLGGRSHGTVLYAIDCAEQRIAADPAYAREVDALAAQLQGGQGRGPERSRTQPSSP